MSEQTDEQKATAIVLGRTLEAVVGRLKIEKGLTDEQVGLALLGTGLNFLSQAWTGSQVVGHLMGTASALADVHSLDPETLEPTRRETRQ